MSALLGLSTGCSRTATCDSPECLAGTETGETGDPSETGETGTDTTDPGGTDLPLPVSKDLDILFVIDNSGSMGEEQARLATNVGALIEVLEAEGVDANYRIGITTTDNGNVWCPAGTTTPEGGKLVLSSCKNRLEDFLFNNGAIDAQLACTDICSLTDAELEILPTTTDSDPNPRPRPWLERIEGRKNIPESTSMAQAFACFAPQGINGCGFESQLESMYLALRRSETVDEDSYGFVRPDAVLAVVILSDEADCSSNKDYSTIFEQDGNRVFWSDPSDSFPTSAVCWNAGVECIGDPSNYDACMAVNKGVDGQLNVSDAEAVLHPMSRYVDLLHGLEQQKQNYNAGNEIVVALIGGVDDTGVPFYADVTNSDPEFQHSFGIGPGCTAPNPNDPGDPATAVPPVRMAELVDGFSPGNMFSICADDYSAAFQAIANSIRTQLSPACFLDCVADTDPSTPIVDPMCTVWEDAPGNEPPVEIPECLRDGNGYVMDPQTGDPAQPSDADNVCFVLVVDRNGLTADPADDMAPECVDAGVNLEFKLIRRPGFPAAGGTTVSADCTPSAMPEQDCPGLGG